jgi:cytochrome c-type biogenesis protein CcmH
VRRLAARLVVIALATAAATATVATTAVPAPAAVTPRASLTDIEQDVMCVSCHEPLALAQSPQADFERAFISRLIAQGMTKPQIEQALVVQYGSSVLGKPPAHGFNLTVYILPPALVVAGAVLLVILLPRWRRRTRAATAAASTHGAPNLTSADARRLNEELARFD